MKVKNLLGIASIVFALVVALPLASAFGQISDVEINGVEALGGSVDFANFAGQTVPVLVRFDATDSAQDVRVKIWVSGQSGLASESERFDVLPNRTYVRTVLVTLPFDLDENLDEPRKLNVVVESEQQGIADQVSIDLTVQRESYLLEILSAQMDTQVKAGTSLVADVVVKNRGSHLAEDTFVRISIPELNLENVVLLGDLSPFDQGGNVADRQDTLERLVALRLPADVKSGVYTVVIEAFNSDASTRLERKVNIVGQEQLSTIVVPITTRAVDVGESAQYSVTIVNRGNELKIYELAVDSPVEMNIDVSDPVLVVPPSSSRTARITVSSDTAGQTLFNVNILSDGKIIDTKTFVTQFKKAKQEEKPPVVQPKPKVTDNAALLLTVVLAIIFVVLLIVLIVLLARKPERKEEESYY
ncbi:hypothetical protein D6817_04010 [Candidatus Pacearchaeota archaeon]|nr:MAG: hypothetical protein D6817_04010 [Candidatus Pacearchaeota archaeon]